MLGYKYLNQIENNLKTVLEDLNSYFREIINASQSKGWFGYKSFYISLAMLYLLDKEKINEFSKKASWDKDIINRIKKIIQDLKNF